MKYIKEFTFNVERPEVGEIIDKLGDNNTLAAVLKALHGPDHGIQILSLYFHWYTRKDSFFVGLGTHFFPHYEFSRAPKALL